VIFPKNVFTQKKAIGWLEKHNYDHGKIDVTDNYYRFRQSDPSSGSSFYTVRLPNGVELICEKEAMPESSSESESDSEQKSNKSNKSKLIAEHKNLVKVLKQDKPKEIKAELAKQSEELKSMTPKKSSPAQIAHRKRFGEWIRSKSGKSFAEWLKSSNK
jgi:uncharacterized protein YdaT